MTCPHYKSIFDNPEPWTVVQNAGFANEKVIHSHKTFKDAHCAMHESYTEAEIDELHVDILKYGSSEY